MEAWLFVVVSHRLISAATSSHFPRQLAVVGCGCCGSLVDCGRLTSFNFSQQLAVVGCGCGGCLIVVASQAVYLSLRATPLLQASQLFLTRAERVFVTGLSLAF